MAKHEFSCDAIWWSEQTKEEKEYWLKWAKDRGAEGEPFFVDRNPHYPDLICLPSVSVGITDEDLHRVRNLSDEDALEELLFNTSI